MFSNYIFFFFKLDNFSSNYDIPVSATCDFLFPNTNDPSYNVWYAANVIFRLSLALISSSPLSGRFIVACLMISSNS